MPDILIGGGDSTNGSISGLLGLKLLEQLGNKQEGFKEEKK
jgi:hypothetical protein